MKDWIATPQKYEENTNDESKQQKQQGPVEISKNCRLEMPAPKHQEIDVTEPRVRQRQDVLAFIFCVGFSLALWAEVFSRI